MADKMNIGAGIGLDGEKEFKDAVKGINKDLSVLGSEMKKVTAQFDGNADSMESLTAKQKVYNDRADEQRKKIEVMTSALENAKKEFGENSDQVKDWQIKLNNAEADLAKTENSLKNTAKQIDEFGKEANDGGNEIEKAGKQAKNSGNDAEKGGGGWGKLGGILGGVATAAGVAVAALTTAAAGAAVAAVKMASDAAKAGAEYADNVNTIAAQTGLSTDEIQQFQYQADMVDVSLETVTGSMAKLTRNMATAQGGTGAAADAFAALGVSITGSNGELRNNQDVFNDAIDALGKMENETQRDAYAMQIFGKSAQDLNPLILAGSDTLNQFAQDAKDSGYVLSGEALTALNDYQDSLDKIAKQKDALSNAIGVAAAPAFKVFTDGADDALKALTKLINGDIDAEEFAAQIGDAVSGIADYITEALPKLMEAGSAILQTIIDAITQNLPMLLNAAIPMITTLMNGIIQMLPALIEAAIPILQALIDGIVQALPMLIPAVVALLMAITQAIVENLPLIVESAMTLIVTLAQGIADALPKLIPAIIDTVLMIVDTLIENIDLLVDASIAIIMALATGLIDALPRLVEKAPEIIAKLVSAIIENAPKLLGAAVELITSLSSGLAENFKTFLTEVGGWVDDNIVQPIKDKVSDFVSAGGELIAGVWQGISDKATWLWEQVSGFFKTLTRKIKNFLGIASPSKVFAGIGDNMAKGIGVGFEDEMTKVSKDINKSIPTNFEADINASRTSGIAGYGTAVSNIYMDSVLVASASSRAQFRKNATRARSFGVVPA